MQSNKTRKKECCLGKPSKRYPSRLIRDGMIGYNMNSFNDRFDKLTGVKDSLRDNLLGNIIFTKNYKNDIKANKRS